MYRSLSLVISETHAFVLYDLSNQSYKGQRSMLRFTCHYISNHLKTTSQSLFNICTNSQDLIVFKILYIKCIGYLSVQLLCTLCCSLFFFQTLWFNFFDDLNIKLFLLYASGLTVHTIQDSIKYGCKINFFMYQSLWVHVSLEKKNVRRILFWCSWLFSPLNIVDI